MCEYDESCDVLETSRKSQVGRSAPRSDRNVPDHDLVQMVTYNACGILENRGHLLRCKSRR
jgi:hypothetical protein